MHRPIARRSEGVSSKLKLKRFARAERAVSANKVLKERANLYELVRSESRDRGTGQVLRALFVQPGTNSRSIQIDLLRGFERAGHRVFHWDLEPMWAALRRAGSDIGQRQRVSSEFTAMVRSVLVHNRIDLSLAMWANALTCFTLAELPGPAGERTGRAASIFDLIPQKHVCYWLDAPHWAHGGEVIRLLDSPFADAIRSPMVHHAINNSATAAEMREILGMKNVIPQHYGIDEETFRPCEVKKELDLVFALGPGDPAPTALMLDQLGVDEPDLAAIRHEAAELRRSPLLSIAKQLPPELGGAATALFDALLKSQLSERHAPMLARLRMLGSRDPSLTPVLKALCRSPRLFVDLTAQVRSLESWERAFTFAYLSRRFNCAAFGSGGAALSAWGVRATHLGELSWEGQAAAYSRARLGLNVMRWQDDAGLNVKPYEITASGTACLCARRAGIDELFDTNNELVVFEGAAEARRQAESALSDPARLDAISATGRARTLRDYTWTAVARKLVQAIV